MAETVGRVHRGFKAEVDDLWPRLEKALIENQKTLWFTGHSLGGAMSTISAGRCFLSHIKSNPSQLYTYGSPRVGDKRYVNHVFIEHYRWVNNNDIVTRVPPVGWDIDTPAPECISIPEGLIRKVTPVQRARDRWRGFWKGIRRGKSIISQITLWTTTSAILTARFGAEREGKLNPKQLRR